MQASEDNGQEQEQAEPAGNLGTRLKRAREARNLSLEDLSQELRIAPNHLEALEQCRFDVLGPPVFAKGYLKHYAARLGLDVAAAVADYERVAGNTRIVVTPTRTIRLRDERQITVWIVAGLALVLLAVFLVLWLLRQDFGGFGFAREPATAAASMPDIGTAAPALRAETGAPAARTAAPASARSNAAPVDGARTEAAAADLERTDAAAGAVSPEAAPAGAAREPSPAAATAAAPPEAPPDAASSPTSPATEAEALVASGGLALEIRFVEDSWTEITAGDGERLFYDLALAGTVERIPLDRDINLLFGNAGGVELSLEGEQLAVPATARRRGDLAEFRLGALLD